MSCQQASRLITTATASPTITTSLSNVVTPEDPYVFTDTLSTAPPILFNTQKSRTRINEAQHKNNNHNNINNNNNNINCNNHKPTTATSIAITAVTAGQQQQQTKTSNFVNQKVKLVNHNPLNSISNTTAATTTATATAITTNTTTVGATSLAATKAQASSKIATATTTTTTTNINNVTQSHKQQQQYKLQSSNAPTTTVAAIATTATAKRAANVCIVRPQQKQQQQQQLHQLQTQKSLPIGSVAVTTTTTTSAAPPPLLTHTPSLWQTPLLLDTTTAITASTSMIKPPSPTSPAVAATTPPLIVSPPTSPASLCSSNASSPVHTLTANGGCTPTATAMVAPIPIVMSPQSQSIGVVGGQPLPPSKFHHTTLAQHLQKVECLKKAKKTPLLAQNSNVESPKLTLKLTHPPPLKVFGTGGTLTKAIISHQQQQQHHHHHHHHHHHLQHQQKQQQQQHSNMKDVKLVDDNDPNEIPVNVIFRKPIASDPDGTQLKALESIEHKPQSVKILPNMKVTISPLTPPTPPSPSPPMLPSQPQLPSMAQLLPQNILSATSQANATPAFINKNVFTLKDATAAMQAENIKSVYTPPPPPPQPPQQRPTQQQPQQEPQTSSMAVTPKRKTPIVGNKIQANNKNCNRKQAPKVVDVVQQQCQQQQQQNSQPPPLNTSSSSCQGVNRNVATPPTSINIKVQSKVKQTTTTTATLKQQKQTRKSNNTPPPLATPATTSITPLSPKLATEKLTSLNTSNAASTVKIESLESNDSLGSKQKESPAPLRVAEHEGNYSQKLIVPYCLQRNWLQASVLSDTTTSPSNRREEVIAEHKSILRRQALQLLATRSLQQLPMSLARQRLQCVDRMLQKYKQRNKDYDVPAKKCLFPTCTNRTLTMASHCLQHIVNNTTQQIFTPCVAKSSDGLPCRAPVFDLKHDVALCTEHSELRKIYEQPLKVITNALPLQQQSQPQQQHKQKQPNQLSNKQLLPTIGYEQSVTTVRALVATNASATMNPVTNASRKRKAITANTKPVGRPQKRTKKQQQQQITGTAPVLAAANLPKLPPISAVMKRKSSTTSLESIASNSQSSSSLAQYGSVTPSFNNNNVGNIAELPALVPLSNHNQNTTAMQLLLNAASQNDVKYSAANGISVNHNNNMINNNNTNNLNFINGNNGNNTFTGSCNAFNLYNTNFCSDINGGFSGLIEGNVNNNGIMHGGGNGINNALANTAGLLTQELFNICENSTYSAYASSEDTGLGGISESELIGTHDADDIPLPDTRLLEEHDLANVLSTLPEDAFNELFDSVRQDECDEMDRQLELADRHIRSLQQSIGSDSDFLGDFLDVNDELLGANSDICDKIDIVSSVMNSPDTTPGIDRSAMFVDSSNTSNSSNGVNNGCHTLTDIRGLVHT